MTVAVTVVNAVVAKDIGRTAAVASMLKGVTDGLTTEKMGVSEGPGIRSGVAVMVAIIAVELTVTTLLIYILEVRDSGFRPVGTLELISEIGNN